MDRSPSVSIPRLRTQRLTLREPRAEDFDAFAAHLGDPETTAFIGSADRQTAWRIFGCQAGLWLLHGTGWWIVEQRETGQVVGNALDQPLPLGAGDPLRVLPGRVGRAGTARDRLDDPTGHTHAREG